MATGCLARAQIHAIASGRCTEKELAVLRRHLADCARCRMAVAARAGRPRGPGDTVLLQPAKRTFLPTAIKAGAVAASLVVMAGAWRYTSSPAPSASPSPSASPVASGTIPATTTQSFELRRDEREAGPPAELTTTAPPSVAPVTSTDAGAERSPPVASAPPRRRRGRRPRRPSASAERSVAEKPSDAEFDFGIDDAPPSAPSVRTRSIP